MENSRDMLPEPGYVAVGMADGGWIQGRPDGHIVMCGDDLEHFGLMMSATIQRWDGPVIVVDATGDIQAMTKSRSGRQVFRLCREGDGIEIASDMVGAPSMERAARAVAQSMERWCPDDMPSLGRNRGMSTLAGMLCMLASRSADGIMSRVFDWAHSATYDTDNTPDVADDRTGRVREAMINDVRRVGRFLGRMLDPSVNGLLDGRTDRVLVRDHLIAPRPVTVYVDYRGDETGLFVTAHAMDAITRWLHGAGKRALIVLHGVADQRLADPEGWVDGWDIVERVMALSPADATVVASTASPTVEGTLLGDVPGVCVSVRGHDVVRLMGDDGGWIEHQAVSLAPECVVAIREALSARN